MAPDHTAANTAEITVYSWECPEDYDYTASEANPMDDCTAISPAHYFRLHHDNPGDDEFADSGNLYPGAVRFDHLGPGTYTLGDRPESSIATDTYLWQCYGYDGADRHISCFETGNDLAFKVAGGEHITCHRFHIPHQAVVSEIPLAAD